MGGIGRTGFTLAIMKVIAEHEALFTKWEGRAKNPLRLCFWKRLINGERVSKRAILETNKRFDLDAECDKAIQFLRKEYHPLSVETIEQVEFVKSFPYERFFING
jgi:hypothetical protein